MLATDVHGRVHNYNDSMCQDTRCPRYVAECGEWEWKDNLREVTDAAPHCWCAATSTSQPTGVPALP